MEQRDIDLIEKHVASDENLARLYKEHVEYEKQLEKFNNKPFLTPSEEMERKRIQKLKLRGKDELENILRRYRTPS